MEAMHGSAIRSHRRRLIGAVMALALVVSALLVTPAFAKSTTPTPGGPIYMALGDSISYGYSAQKFNENYPTESPSRFEEGFTNFFNKSLGKTVKGVTLVNLACPGETSNGLIGENPLLGGMTSTEPPSPPAPYQGPGDWHPCAYHNADGFPLHAGYGSISQLEDAISILTEENKITKKPNEVKAITLNIGNNDVLGLIAQCTYEVEKEIAEKGSSKWGGVLLCFKAQVGGTVTRILANITDTLEKLDEHYSGPIILLAGYDPLAFVDPGIDELSEYVNAQFEATVAPKFSNLTIANPFPVFNKEAGKSPKKEQAAICKYTEMCNPNVQAPGGHPTGKDGDVHPTVAGYKELAKLVAAAYAANPAK